MATTPVETFLATMDADRAVDVLGCVDPKSVPFRNMIKALQMCSALNTSAENERLAAALWARKNRKAFEEASRRRRERRR